MKTFQLTIRTPENKLFKGEVSGVSFTSEGGDMEVFAHHSSVTAALAFSPLVLNVNEKKEVFMLRNGLFLFDNKANEATFLALYAEKRSEVSQKTVKEYVAFLEEQLKKGEDMSEFQILYLRGEKLAVEQQIKALE